MLRLSTGQTVIPHPLTQPSIGASDGIARQGARRDARMSPRDKDIPLDEPIAGEKRREPEGQVSGAAFLLVTSLFPKKEK